MLINKHRPTILKKIFKILILSPFILFIYLMSPIIIFKFHIINSQNFASLIFWPYLYKEVVKNRSIKKKNIIDIITYNKPVSNKIYLKGIKKIHKVYEPNLILCFFINSIISLKINKLIFTYGSNQSLTNNRLWLDAYNNNINFKLEIFNNKYNKKIKDYYPNIFKNNKIVCIHNRDISYNHHVNSLINWQYHNYRNFSIKSYDKLIKYLLNNNFIVVRVGTIASEKININHPNLSDLPYLKKYNHYLNIYFLSNCHSFIGGDSGVSWLPYINNKNIFLINYSPFEINNLTMMTGNISFIFQLIFSKKTNRLLYLSEIIQLKSKLNSNQLSDDFYFVLNSPQEIFQFYNAKSKTIQDLHNSFWKIFCKYSNEEYIGINRPFVCNDFLIKYQNLIK